MPKSKTKHEKLYFNKSPKGYGYHANHVHSVPEDLAKGFKKKGIARPATQTLPNELPGCKAFIAAGHETLEDIRSLEDPTSVDGIGDTTAQELAEWFAKNEG